MFRAHQTTSLAYIPFLFHSFPNLVHNQCVLDQTPSPVFFQKNTSGRILTIIQPTISPTISHRRSRLGARTDLFLLHEVVEAPGGGDQTVRALLDGLGDVWEMSKRKRERRGCERGSTCYMMCIYIYMGYDDCMIFFLNHRYRVYIYIYDDDIGDGIVWDYWISPDVAIIQKWNMGIYSTMMGYQISYRQAYHLPTSYIFLNHLLQWCCAHTTPVRGPHDQHASFVIGG